MVLAALLLQPVSELRAQQSGLSLVICAQNGAAPEPGQPAGGHGNCPCLVACGTFAGQKHAKALHPVETPLLLHAQALLDWRFATHLEAYARGADGAVRAIRGPPFSV